MSFQEREDALRKEHSRLDQRVKEVLAKFDSLWRDFGRLLLASYRIWETVEQREEFTRC
jgi:hypothetical protein